MKEFDCGSEAGQNSTERTLLLACNRSKITQLCAFSASYPKIEPYFTAELKLIVCDGHAAWRRQKSTF